MYGTWTRLASFPPGIWSLHLSSLEQAQSLCETASQLGGWEGFQGANPSSINTTLSASLTLFLWTRGGTVWPSLPCVFQSHVLTWPTKCYNVPPSLPLKLLPSFHSSASLPVPSHSISHILTHQDLQINNTGKCVTDNKNATLIHLYHCFVEWKIAMVPREWQGGERVNV